MAKLKKLLEKYAHYSFDLDGTLVVTTKKYRCNLLKKVVEKLGGEIKSAHIIDKFWFDARREEVIKKEFKVDVEKFWEFFVKWDIPEERSKHTFPYRDAEPALKKLKNAGKITSVITGSPHAVAQMEIKKLNGVSCDFYLPLHGSVFNPKPDPASLRFVIRKTSTLTKNTLYIGNSNDDAYYAKNAGVSFVYLERKEYVFNLESYAIAKISSLEELFE